MSRRERLDRSSVFSTLIGDVMQMEAAVDQRTLPLEAIHFNPRQPRKYIDLASLDKLTESVRQQGILEPVLVRQVGEGYELIAGERRTRAAIAAGLSAVPAVILDVDDAQALEIAVVENLQREDINPVEETDAILTLLGNRLERPTSEVVQLLRKVYDESRGRSGNNVISSSEREQVEGLFSVLGRFSVSSFYTNRLPLLNLPPDLLGAVRRGELHYTKARMLARLEDEAKRGELLRETKEQDLSLKGLRERVKTEMAEGDNAADMMLTRVKRQLTSTRLKRLSARERREAERLLAKLGDLLGKKD